MHDNTAIIIPCYNEFERLKVEHFLDFIKSNTGVDFYFVNDGSTDKTLEILNKLAAESSCCHVVNNPRNRGKAYAVFTGFNVAFQEKYKYIGFWDADLATPLKIIPDFIKMLEREEYHAIFGCRIQRLGSNIKRKVIRHYCGRFLATLISHILKLHIYDTQCGAKILRNTDNLHKVFSEPFSTKWIFDVELIARLQILSKNSGLNLETLIYEYPLEEWNDIAGSKVTFFDGIKALLDLLKIKYKYH